MCVCAELSTAGERQDDCNTAKFDQKQQSQPGEHSNAGRGLVHTELHPDWLKYADRKNLER